jgi:hypothetical protein
MSAKREYDWKLPLRNCAFGAFAGWTPAIPANHF